MSHLNLVDLEPEYRQSVVAFRQLLDMLREGVEEPVGETSKIVVRWHECDFMGLCSIDPIESDSIDSRYSFLVERILSRWNNVVGSTIRLNDKIAYHLNVDKSLVWRSFFDDGK